MRLTFYGHACLRLQGERASLICDPWFAMAPAYSDTIIKYPFVSSEVADDVYGCSHVYLSHHHEDHFHVPTLKCFAPSTHFHIPAFEYVAHSRGRSMERTLRAMGFENISVRRSWESFVIDLGPPVHCTLIPSARSRPHDWENSGLLMRAGRHTLVDLNDNIADDALLAQIRSLAPSVDFAFVQGFQATEYPANFDLPVREKLRVGRLKRGNVNEALKVVRGLSPGFVSPIAADLCWFRKEDFYKNYSDKPNPSRFGPLLAKLGGLENAELLELEPGDAVLLTDEPIIERREVRLKRLGFRRRLDHLSDRVRAFSSRTRSFFEMLPFDRETVTAFVSSASVYFPSRIALPGTARIDFSICRHGDPQRSLAGFSLWASDGEARLSLDAPRDVPVDQEILVPGSIWMASCAGLVLRANLFVLCVNRQIRPFRMEIAHLRYLFTGYADFGDISTWARINPADARYNDVYAQYQALLGEQPPAFSDADLSGEYERPEPVS